MSARKHFQPIAQRLSKILYRIGFLLMLVIVMVYAVLSYFDVAENLHAQLVSLAQEHRPRLSAALWDIDPIGITDEIDTLSAVSSVAGLVLTTPSGARYLRGDTSESAKELSYTIELMHKSSVIPVGSLTLISDRYEIWKQVAYRVFPFALAQLLFVTGLLFALQLFLRKVVLRRLDALTIHTHLLRPDHLDTAPPPPLFESPVRDELDNLLQGFANLQNNLLHQQQQRGQLIHALAESRDQLEVEVAQRTDESFYLSGFLQLLSKDAARYLSMPLDGAKIGLEQTLKETGQLMGLDALITIHFADDSQKGDIYFWDKDDKKIRTDFNLGKRSLFQLSKKNLDSLSAFIMGIGGDLPDESDEAALCRDLHLTQLAVLPLDFNGERLGLLFAGVSDQDRVYSELEMRLLPLVAGLCSNVLAHRRQQLSLKEAKNALLAANTQLERLTRHDALTGIANRRVFDERLEQEMANAIREQQPLLLIVLDVDSFKQYNDSFGRHEGDIALQKVAAVLAKFAERTGDCAARIEGNEFVLLLPNTDLHVGKLLAERIRLAMIKLGLVQEDGSALTISQGLAVYSGAEEISAANFLRLADKALYRAKRSGNQVQVLESISDPVAGKR
ncbi:GGDEF domain-containing protein [Iodobacter fluviatilis]|uniref:diguanylate cyclase n=1 Tax=Iodobacter fluviatilis TaxID=537 RepID=A0A377SW52_9NEIS|nr:GGDEF domain-containing protein [Iodobacter fluviatilis]TCU85103.1 diguanylate cyclase (GGDEF)-like protein [Iodobacter fluviatilis]STR45213.1 Bacteriophytochrome cph2 [Iodobacter fluviatilis]